MPNSDLTNMIKYIAEHKSKIVFVVVVIFCEIRMTNLLNGNL